MSWILNLNKTYEACKNVVGISGDSQEGILLPVGHLLTEADIIVHLGSEGTFLRAEKTDSKLRNLICVPCTDESESRSGRKAIDFPHPLFDQIKYYATQRYRDNLKEWLGYLEETRRHPIAVRAISAVYQYILKDSLQDDMESYQISVKDQLFTAFCVNLNQSFENRLWCMPELWYAWIEYYFENLVPRKATKDTCYITGLEDVPFTEKHPKSINRISGNAKLITGNDNDNFTFRGRFEDPSQAVTVSYEASQKAHQTLRWLISKTSCYRCGSQAIIAWAVDNMPDITPFYKDSCDVYSMVASTDEAKLVSADSTIYVDYAFAFKKLYLVTMLLTFSINTDVVLQLCLLMLRLLEGFL
jgi:CRISPR-associated protein Csd1